MMSDWQPIAKDHYNPLKAGSVDGTDTEPHDRAVWRAMNSHYNPPDVDTKPSHTLFVGRLPHNIEEEQLHHKFSAFGVVEKIRLIRDIVTGCSKGYCFVEYRRKRDAEHAVRDSTGLQISGSPVLVDWEAGHQVKGWIPRRLGGGWGGRKEAGQLRFGCRDRPWKKPIVINPSRPLPKEHGKDTGKLRHQDSQGSEDRHKREDCKYQDSQGSEDRHRREDNRHQGSQGFDDRHRREDNRHHGSQGLDDRHRREDNRHQDRQGSAEDRHRRADYRHKDDMMRREERRERHRDRTSDRRRRRSRSPSGMSWMLDTSTVVSEGQNKLVVKCPHCDSQILSPHSARLLSEAHPLPTPTQPKEQTSPTTEDLVEWWLVDDMFTFDNIGFSHTVGTTKYLVCADCERGPLGWHDNTSKKSYVALARVKHV